MRKNLMTIYGVVNYSVKYSREVEWQYSKKLFLRQHLSPCNQYTPVECSSCNKRLHLLQQNYVYMKMDWQNSTDACMGKTTIFSIIFLSLKGTSAGESEISTVLKSHCKVTDGQPTCLENKFVHKPIYAVSNFLKCMRAEKSCRCSLYGPDLASSSYYSALSKQYQ
ncbi:hypothetical protein Y032_0022g588 [Ancylostoma ceylanicum]|uniref:Uncharacterized protein n=1 Tax=Ancylostoma ceylanicum TaxID=53326 RepID=A0A016UY62_9BILA|nr:hypothetical protein Y032_0022g588 [Ancylostoma ceylanicum]